MKRDITIHGKRYTAAEVKTLEANLPSDMPKHMVEVFHFLARWYNDEANIEQQTSGSTGVPTMISLQKQHMWNSALTTNTFFSLHKGDNVLIPLSMSTIAGKMMVVRAIAGGLNLLVIPTSGTPEIPDEKIAFVPFVPMQMEQMLENGLWQEKIQTVILGGAAVSESLQKKLEKLSSRVYATYGMTETCSHVAVQRLNGYNHDETFRVLPGTTVSTNQEGCITINAPHVLSAPITTSDLGEIPEPGRLRILGRKDFIINSGGVKINPIPLEEHLRKQINRELVIVPLPDKKLGQKAVVVVEGDPDQEILTRMRNFINIIRKEHPLAKEPLFLKRFPLTKSMKTDRKELIKSVS